MRVTIWGCRGSLPTPGPKTLRYGGHTTCIQVEQESGPPVVVDAGSGIRQLGQALAGESKLRELYLYLTHAHWDHLMGFPFFVPGFLEDWTIRVRGGPLAKGLLRNYLEHQMDAPFFPVPFGALGAEFDFVMGVPQPREVGSCAIDPVPLNHPNGGFGFVFAEGEKRFAFLPDNELDHDHGTGLGPSHYVDACREVEVLLHDAQYLDEEYGQRKGWGHTKLTSLVDLAAEAHVGRLGLFHHDPDRTDDQIDVVLERVQSMLAKRGSEIECFAAAEGLVIDI